MNRTWIDMGCSGRLSQEAGRGFQKNRAFFRKERKDLFVYSVGEGDHQMDSRHYGEPIAFAEAWDIGWPWRFGSRISKIKLAKLKAKLGKDFDVVPNAKRGIVHIEFDPK